MLNLPAGRQVQQSVVKSERPIAETRIGNLIARFFVPSVLRMTQADFYK